MTSLRWVSADLEALPDDGKRYEIIGGKLYVSEQPHWCHQLVCGRLFAALKKWDEACHAGVTNLAPGVIFDDYDDVAPDVVWISNTRLATFLAPDGKLHGAPDLAIEVLSPGSTNERRDREAKPRLYSRRNVSEYWIVDWTARLVEVYRRADSELTGDDVLRDGDFLGSPLLVGFSLAVAYLFAGFPAAAPRL
jgi:Uma2 family endonuclease